MLRINDLINKILNKVNPILIIKKSKLFNAQWYAKKYNISKLDAAKHYLFSGYKLGYNPSELFNNDLYMELYPDINRMNPLIHYELYGKKENRKIRIDLEKGLSFKIEELPKRINKDKDNIIYVDLYLDAKSKSGAKDYSSSVIKKFLNDSNVLVLEYKQWSNDWLIGLDNSAKEDIRFEDIKCIFEKIKMDGSHLVKIVW